MERRKRNSGTTPRAQTSNQGATPEELKLVEVSESEVLIDFKPNAKCRATVHLRSLHPALPVSFKVQTSSPHKFHVNPPNGLLPPLSPSLPLRLVLRPQPHPPSSFPRSPSDRFLIKASTPDGSHHHDLKLKVAYVGPFLLRHAASLGDSDAIRHILRRQPSLLPLPADQWGALHVAAAEGRVEEVRELVVSSGGVEARALLLEGGADGDARSKDGRTAMHRAAANGDVETVALLLEAGVDAGAANARGKSPLDVARDKGHLEVVELLERGEKVLTAARKGDLRQLEKLLSKRVGIRSQDQYGITALHSAAIKGHRDAISLLVERGMDTECKDVEGHTPLHLAVEGGSMEAVELLVEMGADVNARTKRGATPLYMARSMGYEAISQLLLAKGASSPSSCLPSSSSSSASSLTLCS